MMFGTGRLIRAIKAAVRAAMEEHDADKESPSSVRRLDLREGDIVVITYDRKLSLEAMKQIRQTWDQFFPQVKAVVFDDGMDVAVMHAATKDAPPVRAGGK
jgi:hypothetical protein